MAKLTVAGIKQQIAALEAKALRLAEGETKASVARVRSLMDSLGVTVEHLTAAVSKKVRAAKKAVASKKAATSKTHASAKRTGAGAVRYRDPATGATWSGFGRAPAWLASVANREVFAVGKATNSQAEKKEKAKTAAAPRNTSRAAKKVAAPAKKAAGIAKRAAKKVKSAAAPAPARKAAPRKAPAKRAAAAPSVAEASASKAPSSN